MGVLGVTLPGTGSAGSTEHGGHRAAAAAVAPGLPPSPEASGDRGRGQGCLCPRCPLAAVPLGPAVGAGGSWAVLGSSEARAVFEARRCQLQALSLSDLQAPWRRDKRGTAPTAERTTCSLIIYIPPACLCRSTSSLSPVTFPSVVLPPRSRRGGCKHKPQPGS